VIEPLPEWMSVDATIVVKARLSLRVVRLSDEGYHASDRGPALRRPSDRGARRAQIASTTATGVPP